MLSQKVLHGGDHAHDLLKLAGFVDTRRLVAWQDDEHALIRLADATQGGAGIRRKLLSRLPGIRRGLCYHRGLELVESGENKGGSAYAVLTARREDDAVRDQLADALACGHDHVGTARPNDH